MPFTSSTSPGFLTLFSQSSNRSWMTEWRKRYGTHDL